jgi:hypothetical protein
MAMTEQTWATVPVHTVSRAVMRSPRVILAVFPANLPVRIVALIAASRIVPDSRHGNVAKVPGLLGVALLTIGVGAPAPGHRAGHTHLLRRGAPRVRRRLVGDGGHGARRRRGPPRPVHPAYPRHGPVLLKKQRKKRGRPMSSIVFGITFDAGDAKTVASFWAAALGRNVADGATEAAAAVEADPAIPGSRIGFRQVPENKTVKNRMHFDLATGDFDAEADRLTRLGATKLNEVNAGLHYATFADPEGNEFDLIAR